VNTSTKVVAPPTDRLETLRDAGVSIWLDSLSRQLLDSGEFGRLVAESSVTGATSNPTIFANAIAGSESYESQLRSLLAAGARDRQELFFSLALEDVRRAADVLRPVYDATHGVDGFVSFEVTPDLAGETGATIDQAHDLWRRIQRPNAMIKVPATSAGVPAIEALTADGINVNVTLLFSVDRYREVLDAYERGLDRRNQRGKPIDGIASVASFFVSRVDSKVDDLLPADSTLRGRLAVANATTAFDHFRSSLASVRWKRLAAAGARPQRPLWASTGTKNAAYSDVLYVESLIAAGVVNTMPRATLDAFADHGRVSPSLGGRTDAQDVLSRAAAADVDLGTVTTELEREGIETFCDSYRHLLACIGERADALSSDDASSELVSHK
jgi:transaldolase